MSHRQLKAKLSFFLKTSSMTVPGLFRNLTDLALLASLSEFSWKAFCFLLRSKDGELKLGLGDSPDGKSGWSGINGVSESSSSSFTKMSGEKQPTVTDLSDDTRPILSVSLPRLAERERERGLGRSNTSESLWRILWPYPISLSGSMFTRGITWQGKPVLGIWRNSLSLRADRLYLHARYTGGNVEQLVRIKEVSTIGVLTKEFTAAMTATLVSDFMKIMPAAARVSLTIRLRYHLRIQNSWK